MSNDFKFVCSYGLKKKIDNKEIGVIFSLKVENNKVNISYYIPFDPVPNKGERTASVDFNLTEEEVACVSNFFGETVKAFKGKYDEIQDPNIDASLNGKSEQYGGISKYGTEETLKQVKRMKAFFLTIREKEFARLETDFSSLLFKKPKSSSIEVLDDFYHFSFASDIDGNYHGIIHAKKNVEFEGDRKIGFVFKKEEVEQISKLYSEITDYLTSSESEIDLSKTLLNFNDGDKTRDYVLDGFLAKYVDGLENAIALRLPQFGALYSAIKLAKETVTKKAQEERENQIKAEKTMNDFRKQYPSCFYADGNFSLETLERIGLVLRDMTQSKEMPIEQSVIKKQ